MYRAILAIALAVLFSGCTSIKITSTAAGTAGVPLAGTTFDVYPLDFSKSSSLEFHSLRSVAVTELSKKGMRLVDASKEEPTYLVLFDYAVGLGVEAAYERRFVSFTYDPRTKSMVHRSRVISEGSSKQATEIFPAIIRHVYETFPAGQAPRTQTIMQ